MRSHGQSGATATSAHACGVVMVSSTLFKDIVYVCLFPHLVRNGNRSCVWKLRSTGAESSTWWPTINF